MLPKNVSEDRRIRRTKRNLKRAFTMLMKEKTYRSITVTDIVNRADYNRTTFYRHYQDKEELVQELVDDMIAELTKAFRFPYKNNRFVKVDALSPSNVIIFDHILKNADFYSLWKNSEGIPGFQDKIINTFIELHKNDIVYFPNQQTEMDDDYFITYRAYGVWGLIVKWIKDDFKTPSHDMAIQLIKIINYHPREKYETRGMG
ncbi:TetR/AcrR family transcriptional regulator [Oceanobacillus saliphilus]|uniref:TetR/AcrR family transcriptional regulator n=1 Tax=Oceanobacillus saliphilus TaxID=2925834 RepID=UPI00201DC5FD|nr:TetR/AcrR family transcriptional regulator [Oceanobacillus saliphilus]